MTAPTGHEVRILVDGELIEADSGRTFDNVNPATEEVLGPGGGRLGGRGAPRRIHVARSVPSTPPTGRPTGVRRKDCLGQLQERRPNQSARSSARS